MEILQFFKHESEFLKAALTQEGFILDLPHEDMLAGYFHARHGFNHTLVFNQPLSICFINGRNH